MKFPLLTAALIATAAISAPATAQTAPVQRAAEPTQAESELRSPTLWLLLVLASIAALFLVLSGGDKPDSP